MYMHVHKLLPGSISGLATYYVPAAVEEVFGKDPDRRHAFPQPSNTSRWHGTSLIYTDFEDSVVNWVTANLNVHGVLWQLPLIQNALEVL